MKKVLIIFILSGLLVIPAVRAQREVNIDQAIDLALKNNPAVSVVISQIKEADAKFTQAHSTFLPQANVLSKYFYTNNLPGMYPLAGVSVPVLNNGTATGDNIVMHPMAPYPNLDRDAFSFDFNVVYPIYAGNKRVNATESTKKLKEAYTNSLKETESSLRLKVKTAFYNNLLIDAVIKVYEDALQQMNAHLDLAKKAYNEGVRSEFDILNFQSKVEEFKSKIIELKGKKQIAQTALRNLMALPDGEQIICKGSIDQVNIDPSLANSNSLNKIRTGNYKIQSLANMKEALTKKEKIEAAGNLPTLFAFGNYHIYHGMDFPPFDKTWRNGYALGIGIKINLFDGNMTKGKVQEVRANMAKIDAYKKGLALQLRYSYQTSIENIQSLMAQQKAHQLHLQVAEKGYHIAETGYKNGVTTNIELNDAQLNVTRIKTTLLNIKKSLLIEYAKLEYLKGSNQ
jgi:outer membrane protein